MSNKQIEIHKGQLSWIPKTVIYKGNKYSAPLDLLPIMVREVIIKNYTK
jgi:hypothetical protein